MIIENELDELIEFTDSKKMRNDFRKHTKKLYKYMLCGILHDIVVFGDYWTREGYSQAKIMSLSPSFFPNEHKKGYTIIKDRIIANLKESYFHQYDRDSQVDLMIKFLRDYLKSYKEKGKTLYLVSELEKILDIKRLFLSKGVILKDHHWIDINLRNPATPTLPEFYNYMDLINLWNDFIVKYNKVVQMQEEKRAVRENPTWRELEYTYTSSLRTLIILAVNFVESYLYYYFYNAKQEKSYPSNKLFYIKGHHIQDTQIIEDLIFEEHHYIKSDKHVQELYSTYEEVVDIRNRLVHTSAFVDTKNKIGELQPLLNVNLIDSISHLQTCIDLVYFIDSKLPDKEKILFWWDKFESPNFSKRKKISVLNQDETT